MNSTHSRRDPPKAAPLVIQAGARRENRDDKTLAWRRVPTASLDLKGLNIAVVGGAGARPRAFFVSLAVNSFSLKSPPRIES